MAAKNEVELDWHFSRPEVAARVLKDLDVGLFNVFVMFEQRRFGKTEFLLRDLAPAAEKGGYRVVYANLWESDLPPAAKIVQALGYVKSPLLERLKALSRTAVDKIGVDGEIYGVKAGVEISLKKAKDPERQSTLIALMKSMGDTLAKRKEKVLFLIDEVQALGASDDNLPLVRALRTMLDTHKTFLKVVFTGSSREGLQAMFSRKDAPFFNSGAPLKLPALDRGFVEHIAVVYKKTTGRALDVASAVEAFHELKSSPFYFRKLVNLAVLSRETDLMAAVPKLREMLPVEMGYRSILDELSPMDRCILANLEHAGGKYFTEAFRTVLGKCVGGRAPSSSAVQGSLKKLVRKKLIVRVGDSAALSDVYVLEDEEFGVWLRTGIAERVPR